MKHSRRNATTVAANGTVVTTTTAAAPRKKGTGSARQQKRDEMLASIRLAYYALSPQARNGFQRLCRQIPGNQVIGKTGMKQRITTFVFFSLLNQAARYAGAANAVTVPAVSPEYVDPIPSSVHLVSAYDAQGVWSLKLVGAAYPNSLSVALAPPAMEASNYQPNAFVQAGPLPLGLLFPGSVDVTPMFLAIYPAAPLVGEKVAAQLMGVLPSGFATEKVTLPAMTTGAADADTDEGDLRAA